jgi:hypothetical protein
MTAAAHKPPLPSADDVEAAIRLLDPAADPGRIADGQPAEHRLTALLAHAAAAAQLRAEQAQRVLSTFDAVELYTQADIAAVAGLSDEPERLLVTLQRARLRQARYVMQTLRAPGAPSIPDTCLASLDALLDLLQAYADAQPEPDAGPAAVRVPVGPLREAMRRLTYAQEILDLVINPR